MGGGRWRSLNFSSEVISGSSHVSRELQALGEATETQAWLDIAIESGYIDQSIHTELNEEWRIIGARLQTMIDKADQFVLLNAPKKPRLTP